MRTVGETASRGCLAWQLHPPADCAGHGLAVTPTRGIAGPQARPPGAPYPAQGTFLYFSGAAYGTDMDIYAARMRTDGSFEQAETGIGLYFPDACSRRESAAPQRQAEPHGTSPGHAWQGFRGLLAARGLA